MSVKKESNTPKCPDCGEEITELFIEYDTHIHYTSTLHKNEDPILPDKWVDESDESETEGEKGFWRCSKCHNIIVDTEGLLIGEAQEIIETYLLTGEIDDCFIPDKVQLARRN